MRIKTRMLGVAALVMMMAAAAWAAGDTSSLRPPPGHRIALVAFEDLECPMCARAEPLLEQAERNYGIPLVRHDFIIPSHAWSMEAHIMARYFDTQSRRTWAMSSGPISLPTRAAIYKANLREWADKFAAAHHTALPAFYDPTGALRAKVEADTQLGRAGRHHAHSDDLCGDRFPAGSRL